VFHDITQLAREIKAMFLSEPPIMRAFSVGFIPKEFDQTDFHVITKQELLEISAVPVPANAEALSVAAKSYSPKEEKEVLSWLQKMEAEKEIRCIKCDKLILEKDAVEVKIDETYAELWCKECIEKKKKTEKSPACRQAGETKEDCVARKIPEIMDENPDMKQNQAVAIAESMCGEKCKAQEGDECEMDNGDMGEMHPNDDGDMVCMPKKKKEAEEKEVKEILSELEIELKEGRKISSKTLEAINEAITSMRTAISVLKELRKLADKPQENGEGKSAKGRIEVAQKSRNQRVRVQALRKVDKIINNLLKEEKND